MPLAALNSPWLKAHHRVIRKSCDIPSHEKMTNTLMPENDKYIDARKKKRERSNPKKCML